MSTRVTVNIAEVKNLQIERKGQMVEPKGWSAHLTLDKVRVCCLFLLFSFISSFHFPPTLSFYSLGKDSTVQEYFNQ